MRALRLFSLAACLLVAGALARPAGEASGARAPDAPSKVAPRTSARPATAPTRPAAPMSRAASLGVDATALAPRVPAWLGTPRPRVRVIWRVVKSTRGAVAQPTLV